MKFVTKIFILFFRVIKKEEKEKHLNEIFYSPLQKVQGWSLCMQTILALYHKKLTYTKKNITHTLLTVRIKIRSRLLLIYYCFTYDSIFFSCFYQFYRSY